MQRCNDVEHEDDLEVEYLNLTCGFAVMSKLQTRRIEVKQRIEFLNKMSKEDKLMSDFQGMDFFKDLPTASEKTVAQKVYTKHVLWK